MLSAIMAKIGVYAVIRFVVPVFEESFARYALILAYMGVIGMMYCGIAALAQKDFKRMLAFSSVAHAGVMLLLIAAVGLERLRGFLNEHFWSNAPDDLLNVLVVADRLDCTVQANEALRAVGAGYGAIGGGTRSALYNQREKERVVKNCLRGRGYRVLN